MLWLVWLMFLFGYIYGVSAFFANFDSLNTTEKYWVGMFFPVLFLGSVALVFVLRSAYDKLIVFPLIRLTKYLIRR
jgi:hypothetical protein